MQKKQLKTKIKNNFKKFLKKNMFWFFLSGKIIQEVKVAQKNIL